MNVFRSRVMMALIGMIIVSGVSVGLTVTLSSQSAQTALVGVARSNNGTATTGPGTPVARPTATATARPATPTPRPTATPGSQLASVRGVVANPSASAGTFVVNTNGSSVTIVVTSKTTFSGVANSMSALTAGLYASVRGTTQQDGTFLATSVSTRTNIDN